MKINNVNSVNMNPYKKQIDKNQAIQNTSRQDKVEISQEAIKLRETQAGDRAERIQQLKKQVMDGTYEVNSTEVAGKLLSFWNKA